MRDSYLSLLYSWHCCKHKQRTKPLPGFKILPLWRAAQPSFFTFSMQNLILLFTYSKKCNHFVSVYLWPRRWISIHLYSCNMEIANGSTSTVVLKIFQWLMAARWQVPGAHKGKVKCALSLGQVPGGMPDTHGSPRVQVVQLFLRAQCRSPLWAPKCLPGDRRSPNLHL